MTKRIRDDDAEPVMDVVLPDTDEKLRADGWRLHVYREYADGNVYIARERALPEKVSDPRAFRVFDSILFHPDEMMWLYERIGELVAMATGHADADSLRQQVRELTEENERLRALTLNPGATLHGSTITEIAAERDRLRSDLSAAVVSVDAMAERIEQMRPVYEAAVEWHGWYGSDDADSVWGAAERLWAATDAAVSVANPMEYEQRRCCPRYTWGDGAHDLNCDLTAPRIDAMAKELADVMLVYEAACEWRRREASIIKGEPIGIRLPKVDRREAALRSLRDAIDTALTHTASEQENP